MTAGLTTNEHIKGMHYPRQNSGCLRYWSAGNTCVCVCVCVCVFWGGGCVKVIWGRVCGCPCACVYVCAHTAVCACVIVCGLCSFLVRMHARTHVRMRACAHAHVRIACVACMHARAHASVSAHALYVTRLHSCCPACSVLWLHANAHTCLHTCIT